MYWAGCIRVFSLKHWGKGVESYWSIVQPVAQPKPCQEMEFFQKDTVWFFSCLGVFFLWLWCLLVDIQSLSEGLQNHFPSSHWVGNVGSYLRKSATSGTNNRVTILGSLNPILASSLCLVLCVTPTWWVSLYTMASNSNTLYFFCPLKTRGAVLGHSWCIVRYGMMEAVTSAVKASNFFRHGFGKSKSNFLDGCNLHKQFLWSFILSMKTLSLLYFGNIFFLVL